MGTATLLIVVEISVTQSITFRLWKRGCSVEKNPSHIKSRHRFCIPSKLDGDNWTFPTLHDLTFEWCDFSADEDTRLYIFQKRLFFKYSPNSVNYLFDGSIILFCFFIFMHFFRITYRIFRLTDSATVLELKIFAHLVFGVKSF